MRNLTSGAVGALAIGLGVAVAVPAAHAQGFYEGKTVTMIVPHSTTGNFGRYSQLLAPYLEEALNAEEVRIEHHRGAGGLVGSNLIWASEPDGLTFGLTSGSSLMLAQLAGGQGVQFDATQFTYLGRPTADDRVIFVGADSGIESFEDVLALDRPFKVPSQGVDDDFYAMALLADGLGFDVQFITGYEGAGDTNLAVIRGDTDGRMTSWPSALPVIEAGDGRPILTIGDERFPDFPDVPTALELTDDPEQKRIIRSLINIQSLHRTFIGPPDMNPEAVEEMRAAVMEVLNDPEMLEEAKAAGLPIRPMAGDRQQEVVAEIYEASADIPPILDAAVASIQ